MINILSKNNNLGTIDYKHWFGKIIFICWSVVALACEYSRGEAAVFAGYSGIKFKVNLPSVI